MLVCGSPILAFGRNASMRFGTQVHTSMRFALSTVRAVRTCLEAVAGFDVIKTRYRLYPGSERFASSLWPTKGVQRCPQNKKGSASHSTVYADGSASLDRACTHAQTRSANSRSRKLKTRTCTLENLVGVHPIGIL